MSNLHTIETRLKAIQQLIGKLNTQALSSEELEELVEYTRELYERSVILQYKAYEEKVFGSKSIEAPIEVEAEKVVVTPEVEEQLPETIDEQETEVQEEAQPAFDFSLFDEPATSNEEKAEEPITEEHISVTQTSSDENGVHEERVVVEQVKVTVNEGDATEWVNFLTKEMDQMGGFNAPLSTLVGAFGLNERLQFINELFNGSSEEFAEAVKILDTASDLSDARTRVAGYALVNNWDKESETVHDFVSKLKRRYA